MTFRLAFAIAGLILLAIFLLPPPRQRVADPPPVEAVPTPAFTFKAQRPDDSTETTVPRGDNAHRNQLRTPQRAQGPPRTATEQLGEPSRGNTAARQVLGLVCARSPRPFADDPLHVGVVGIAFSTL